VTWKKGVSGNPGGRPKELAGIQELARKHAPDAIKTLVQVASKGKSESARVAAASSLLDRGYGRPPQFNTGDNVAFRKAIEMNDNELDAAIAETARAIAAAQAETVDPQVTH
jgi:hypothetical protein